MFKVLNLLSLTNEIKIIFLATIKINFGIIRKCKRVCGSTPNVMQSE